MAPPLVHNRVLRWMACLAFHAFAIAGFLLGTRPVPIEQAATEFTATLAEEPAPFEPRPGEAFEMEAEELPDILDADAALELPLRGRVPPAAIGLDAAPPVPPREEGNTDDHDPIEDQPFRFAESDPLSTFSIDVDRASYANLRRHLAAGRLPARGAVRIEEMLNYFEYAYAPPRGDGPFAVHVEAAACPWAPRHRLVRIGLKGRVVDPGARPAANLVFLIDVSGSMQADDRLPLLKDAFRLLVEQLGEDDRVAIVVYAGASGLVLPSTSGAEKAAILAAIDGLGAGGSTNGAAGIRLAYATALGGFVTGGVNRVVLATDGDFNVGTTSRSDLFDLIAEQARTGVFLSVLGFGRGNYQDSTLEMLADRGNGNYAYVDTIGEARKVLVEEMTGTLVTIAKDVKIQVEFNPARVLAHRLIGYEDRLLADRDFEDDRKDAGEIGAGHTVTALYEVVPAGEELAAPVARALRYQTPRAPTPAAASGELLTVRLRHKEPDGRTSRLLEEPVVDRGASFAEASVDFRFAAAVAAFGLVLRRSEFRGSATFDSVLEIARDARGPDPRGLREEFEGLVRAARTIAHR